MRVIAIDPGESIGIVYRDNRFPVGYTWTGDDRLLLLWNTLKCCQPDVIIFETFALRQSSANKLIGNKFITCEVIGIIKLYAQLNNVQLISLTPSCKEYCGFSSNPKDTHYTCICCGDQKITEHVRDAYRLLKYAELFKLK